MFDRINRVLFGGLIGWLGGYSFATALLPFALQALAPETLALSLPLMARWGLASTVLWVPLGIAAALAGSHRRSGLIFAAGALLIGLIYGLLVAAQQWQVALVSTLLAGVYGWGAGSLLGAGFGPVRQNGGANAP
jgi:hypothetical protein